MPQATEHTLSWPEGDDATEQFTLSTIAPDGTKTPVDLTGATVECVVTDGPRQDASTIVTYTTADGSVVVDADPTTGRCTVLFASADLPGTVAARYRLSTVVAGRRTTYAFGDVVIQNV